MLASDTMLRLPPIKKSKLPRLKMSFFRFSMKLGSWDTVGLYTDPKLKTESLKEIFKENIVFKSALVAL